MSSTSPMRAPRLVVGSLASGSGKTTLVCGILRALQRRGVPCVSFKVGPDYIDPMFHRSVLRIDSRNLDLYLGSTDTVTETFARGFASSQAEIAVVEGAMGYYDGLGASSDQGSTWHVGQALAAPAVIAVDARGAALTLAAQIKGLMGFRSPSNIAGVVLNRCSVRSFSAIAAAIERECGVPVLGWLAHDPSIALESRHLGLTCASEVDGLRDLVDRIADAVEGGIDLQALRDIACAAPEMDVAHAVPAPRGDARPVTVAVARDEAFCFYYAENLETLRAAGARVVEFSPLRDPSLPPDADACYLGGGYPEVHAARLSQNESLRRDLARAAGEGMPVIAECGGYLYLQHSLAGADGRAWPMLGLDRGRARLTDRLGRFGYVEVRPEVDGAYLRVGEAVRAHEFHYCVIDGERADLVFAKPTSGASWTGGMQAGSILGSFAHLFFPNCPFVVDRFLNMAWDYHLNKPTGTVEAPSAREVAL